MLIIESSLSNVNEQIDFVYEYLLGEGMIVVKLDHFICRTLQKCASSIVKMVIDLKLQIKHPALKKSKKLMTERSIENIRQYDSDSETIRKDKDFDIDHMSLEKLFKIKEPVVIIIKSIGEMPRGVINDLLHVLIQSRISSNTNYSLIMTMTGSTDVFHEKINTSIIPYLKVKVLQLSSTRDTILAIIAKYVLDYTYLIQPDRECLCWIYEQVLMYNLSLKSFERIILYMNFSKIYRSPVFFLLRYYDSEKMRHKDYQRVFDSLDDERKQKLQEWFE